MRSWGRSSHNGMQVQKNVFYWCHLGAVVISAHRSLGVAQQVICSTAISVLSAIATCTILGVTPHIRSGKRPPMVTLPSTPPHPTAPSPTTALRLQLPLAGAIGDNHELAHLRPQGCTIPFPTTSSLVVFCLVRMLATAIVYLLSFRVTLALVCTAIKKCLPAGPARPTDPTRHIRGDSIDPEFDAPTSVNQPPASTNFTRTLTHPRLTFGALNINGFEITPNRLCHLLAGFHPLPHTLSLQDLA